MTNVDTVGETDRPASRGSTDGHDPVPVIVDWIIGILTGVIGLALTAVGAGILSQVDRSQITDVVTEEEVEVNGLSESEFITAADAFTDWLAFGLILTGLVTLVVAVAFLVARRRTRRRFAREGGTTATFWACAVYGAVVTMLASFIPGSAIVGGGAAASLRDSDESVRTGAAAGLVGAALTIPLVACIAAGMVAGGEAIGEFGNGALLAVIVIGAELLTLAINAGLGALGGFLADRLL